MISHRARLILRSLTAALSLILLFSSLHAQRSDIRLSGDEPRSYALPYDITIQSSAMIGSTGLAVWGTTVFDADSLVARSLVAQLWRGKSAVGAIIPITPAGAIPFGRVIAVPCGGRFLVAWNDMRMGDTAIYMRRIDTLGNGVGDEMRIDGRLLSIVSYPFYPDLLFIVREGIGPIAVHADGGVDDRAPLPDLFTLPSTIASDGMAVAVRNDTVAFYAQPFDTVAVRILQVPALKGALRGSEGLHPNGEGAFDLFFATDTMISEWPYAGVNTLFRMTIPRDSAPGAPTIVRRKWESIGSAQSRAHFSYSGAAALQGCDGSFGRVLGFSGTIITHGRYEEASYQWSYSVDPAGRADTGLAHLTQSCVSRPSIWRTSLPGLSGVSVLVDGDTLTMTTPMAFYRSTISQRYPRLWSRGDSLWAHWSQDVWGKPYAIRRLAPDTALMDRGPVPAGEFASDDLRRNSHGSGWTIGDGSAFGLEVKWEAGYGGSYARQFLFYLAMPDGLHRMLDLHSTAWPLPAYNPLAYGFDPERRRIVIPLLVTTSGGYRRLAMYDVGIDSADIRVIDSVPSSALYSGIVPIADGQYILATRSGADRFVDDHRIGGYLFADTTFAARYQRLRGERFLRTGYRDSADSVLRLELYDLDGALLARRAVTMPDRQGDPFIIQRPSDGMIAILFASRGLHAALFTPGLDPVVADTLLSATRLPVREPAAAFRGDSLLVAWEDYRNGPTADIYGAWFLAPTIQASVDAASDRSWLYRPPSLW